MGYCVTQTSLAHTYGNVTCFITQYLKNLFPENYFKTVHISSTIAYKQFSVFQNKDKEFLRKSKPMLIIRPRVEINNSDNFLYGTYLTTRITDNYYDHDLTNLQPFIHDKDNGVEVKYLLNRLRLLFDVTIVTETQMEQLNQAHFLKNRIRQDRPFFLKTSLESYIPRDMIKLLSQEIGFPMYDENDSIKPFLDHLNGISHFPISYKMKNSTGNDEFFRMYPVNIDTMFSDLSIDDGSKKGMISDTYTITFTVSTEFFAAGLYYLVPKNPKSLNSVVTELRETSSNKLIPLFTVTDLEYNQIADGWNVYAAPMYQVDEESTTEDILDLSSIFNNSLQKVIEYHKKHGIPIKTFMICHVMKNNIMLRDNIDYALDYDNLSLITKNINHSATYRIIINVNTFYINSLIKDLLDLDAEK